MYRHLGSQIGSSHSVRDRRSLSGWDAQGNYTPDQTFVFEDVTCTNGVCRSNTSGQTVSDPFGFDLEPLIIGGVGIAAMAGMMNPIVAGGIAALSLFTYSSRKSAKGPQSGGH